MYFYFTIGYVFYTKLKSDDLYISDNDPTFDANGFEIPVESYNYRLFDDVIKYITVGISPITQ